MSKARVRDHEGDSEPEGLAGQRGFPRPSASAWEAFLPTGQSASPLIGEDLSLTLTALFSRGGMW